jgi:hypothetical protein
MITIGSCRRGRQAMAIKLTSYQQRLLQEIRYISFVGKMELDNLPVETDWRTIHLEHVRDKLVRSVVSSEYMHIDQWLTFVISRHFFKTRQMKGKRKRLFDQYIMDEMYLLQKARIVHAISPLPAKVRQTIDRVNALRNSLAHNLFPENRRQYAAHRKVIYSDVDIFSIKGMEKIIFDVGDVLAALKERALGKALADSEPSWDIATETISASLPAGLRRRS